MKQTVTIGVTLGEGHYWIDWQSNGFLSSGPWVFPVTTNGVTKTGDALQYVSGA
ncbi:MAG: hypothetical protein ACUVRG_05590 [Ignavibacterium sp.]|uniref:hypothetical protein n=1 Tax=Ignavibacterium sp. TaxID=2651167 RepID=UPI00404A2012